MSSTNDFIPSKYEHSVEKGNFSWSAPSNIALVKYWGKKDNQNNQIPANPSVSFTLNSCKTETKIFLFSLSLLKYLLQLFSLNIFLLFYILAYLVSHLIVYNNLMHLHHQ